MNPIDQVRQRANERSAAFIEEHISKALLFGRKMQLLTYVSGLIPNQGLVIECGVFKGRSINHLAKLLPDRTLYGFDSFEGLSEDWYGNHQASGHFDLQGQLPVRLPCIVWGGWRLLAAIVATTRDRQQARHRHQNGREANPIAHHLVISPGHCASLSFFGPG